MSILIVEQKINAVTLTGYQKMSSEKIPTFAQKIEQEVRDIPKNAITELSLDNCDGSTFEGLTTDFTKVEIISAINSKINSLENFPILPELKVLDLSANNISTGLVHLSKCPKLAVINLSENPIKSIEELEPLKDLPDLSKLILAETGIYRMEGYSEKVFELLPQVIYLDHFDREGNPDPSFLEMHGEEEDEEGISLSHFLGMQGMNSGEDDDCCNDVLCEQEEKKCGVKRKLDCDNKDGAKKDRSN
uniref:LRRcap domain-containing protein n=1 Tax=Parastrongyloides trichosuri TaxID=131310 RepID=A0A0N4ZGY6_PARTI